MNISSAEKKQIVAFLIVWALVGILGFAYFWVSNPDRKLDRIVDIKVAKTLMKEAADQLGPQLDAGASGPAPEKISGVPVSAELQGKWNEKLQSFAMQIERKTAETVKSNEMKMLGEPTYGETQYYSGYSREYSTVKNGVSLPSCGPWGYYVEPKNLDEIVQPGENPADYRYQETMTGCFNFTVDAKTKEISDITFDYSY